MAWHFSFNEDSTSISGKKERSKPGAHLMGDVQAAGGLLWRHSPTPTSHPAGSEGTSQDPNSPSAVELLVVHRPRYDDWSFPKGKLERDELPQIAACREVHEEGGVAVVLNRPLGYEVKYDDTQPPLQTSTGQTPAVAPTGTVRKKVVEKRVRYWICSAIDPKRVFKNSSEDGLQVEIVRPRLPVVRAHSDEIDEVRWVSLAELPELLNYKSDRRLLEEFEGYLAAGLLATKTKVYCVKPQRVQKSRWQLSTPRPLSAKGEYQQRILDEFVSCYDAKLSVKSRSELFAKTEELRALAKNKSIAKLFPKTPEELGDGDAIVVHSLPTTGEIVAVERFSQQHFSASDK